MFNLHYKPHSCITGLAIYSRAHKLETLTKSYTECIKTGLMKILAPTIVILCTVISMKYIWCEQYHRLAFVTVAITQTSVCKTLVTKHSNSAVSKWACVAGPMNTRTHSSMDTCSSCDKFLCTRLPCKCIIKFW